MHPIEDVVGRFRARFSRKGGLALVLRGEAGIGKTSTAMTALSALPWVTLSVHADAPLQEVVKQLPAPPHLVRWSEVVLERVRQGEFVPPAALLDAVDAHLSSLAPFVLHLEDLHEANPERLELWRELAKRVSKRPRVGLLATTRGEAPEEFESITIEPLKEDASGALLEQVAGTPLPDAARRWIFLKARGNPLFTLEYFRFLTRRGDLWSDGSTWRWREPQEDALPRSVEALIAQLIEVGLTDAAREALRARSLFKDHVTNEVWREVAALNEAEHETAKTELRRQGLLRCDDLAHPLYGEVVRQDLGKDKARDLARRAVIALQDDWPEEAAGFVDQAGLAADEAVALLVRSARAASERGDARSAGLLLGRAARQAEPPRRLPLALEGVLMLQEVASPDVEALAELAVCEAPELPEAVFALARVRVTQGRGAEAEALVARLGTLNGDGALQLMRLRRTAADVDGVLELWNAFPELHQNATAVSLVVWAHMTRGDLERARQYFEESARTLTAPGERRALLEALLMVQHVTENYCGAEATVTELLGLEDAALYPLKEAFAYSNRSMYRRALCDFRGALQDIEAALERYVALGATRYYLEDLNHLGSILLSTGDVDRAEEYLLEALAYLERSASVEFRPTVELRLAELYAEHPTRPNLALARRYARRAIQSARGGLYKPAEASAMEVLANIEAQYGDPVVALKLASETEALAQRFGGMPVCAAMAMAARGVAYRRLARPQEARVALTQAKAILDQLHARVGGHYVGIQLDSLNDDREAARVRLSELRKLGAGRLAREVLKSFPDLEFELVSHPETFELLVLGELTYRHRGEERPLRGNRTRLLLTSLVSARLEGRGVVDQLHLVDVLYPNQETKGVNALQQLVHRLRTTLGSGVIISTAGGGYALGERVRTDAEQFLAGGDTTLWRGPVCRELPEASGVWERLYAALEQQLLSDKELDSREKTRIALILHEAQPFDLRVLALVLQALRKDRQHKKLARVYANARSQLSEVEKYLPDHWQDFLSDAPFQ